MMRTDDVLAVEITDAGKVKGLAKTAGSYNYLKDSIGTVTEIVNDSGDLVQRYNYSSFGKLLKVSNESGADISASPTLAPYFTFTNREFDSESGMYYYRARYYDANVGRFIESDPDAGGLGMPMTFSSKYIGMGNNTVNNIDPTGEKFVKKLKSWASDHKRGLKAVGSAVVGAAIIIAAVYVSPFNPYLGATLLGTGSGFIYGAVGGYLSKDVDPWESAWKHGAIFGAATAASLSGGALVTAFGGGAIATTIGSVAAGSVGGGLISKEVDYGFSYGAIHGATIGLSIGLKFNHTGAKIQMRSNSSNPPKGGKQSGNIFREQWWE